MRELLVSPGPSSPRSHLAPGPVVAAVLPPQSPSASEGPLAALLDRIARHDPAALAHARRVAHGAALVAAALGLDSHAIAELRAAALLHDIGKLHVPMALLAKPAPLTFAERRIVETHAAIGAKLLRGIPRLAALAPVVLHHHERYDGHRQGDPPGYPDGLSGEAILLPARIIAVVDAFDAMTSFRPYRAARSPNEALVVVAAERGCQFDPLVVDAFEPVAARWR